MAPGHWPVQAAMLRRVALALGPLQFAASLRARHPRLHRNSGRLYLLGVFVGGGAGLLLAFFAQGAWVAKAGFAALAVCWLHTAIRALVAILAGDVVAHRRWMVRNFALTFAAVTLRLYLPAALVSGVPFEAAYPAIAWLCWVPNLLLAQAFLRSRRARELLAASAVPAHWRQERLRPPA